MKPPYPKYVICPDVEGLADHLTAGKRCEVCVPNPEGFEIQRDDGVNRFSFWKGSANINGADWIIPEDETPEQDPPEWSVKLACDRADIGQGFCEVKGASRIAARSIKAHARTIAKYEQEPVDPDLLLARELAAQDAERSSLIGAANEYRAGSRDGYRTVPAALAAIKHIRKHGLPS